LADGSGLLLATLRYAAFAALVVVVPGLGLQRLLRLRPDPALVVPLGLLWCALAHWLSLAAARPPVFPLLCLPWLVLAAWPSRRAPHSLPGPALRGALAPVLACMALFALTQYRVNRVDTGGTFQLDLGEHVDTALHVGLSFELADGYPPQVPGLAGVDMRYHLASHLVRGAAVRWAGVHPYDAISRFDITLWAAALVLALRAAAQACGFSERAVTLAGFAPLACDLSVLPGLLTGSSWWAFKLGANFLEALFYANSIAPAMALALASLVALTRAERGEGHGFTVLAAMLAAGCGFFKAFTGAQLVLALGAAWLLGAGRRRLALVIVPAALALLALASSALAPAGTEGVAVRLIPLAPLQPALRAFGLPQATGAPWLFYGLLWLILSLGLRVAGLPAAVLALRDPRGAPVALAALALCGWPIASLLSVTADPSFDESFYFLQASGLALWVFAAPSAARWLERAAGWRPWPLLAAALAGGLTLAPAAEFVLRKAAQPPEPLAGSAVRAMRALRQASCPGDVVITRPQPREQWVPLPVVLAGRRVVFSNYLPYWRQFVAEGVVEERQRLLRAFFRATEPAEARGIARRLQARFAYLTGQQQVDFAPQGVLEPVFQEGGDRVYRLAGWSRIGCAGNAP
jgi:hypothetical protein